MCGFYCGAYFLVVSWTASSLMSIRFWQVSVFTSSHWLELPNLRHQLLGSCSSLQLDCTIRELYCMSTSACVFYLLHCVFAVSINNLWILLLFVFFNAWFCSSKQRAPFVCSFIVRNYIMGIAGWDHRLPCGRNSRYNICGYFVLVCLWRMLDGPSLNCMPRTSLKYCSMNSHITRCFW